MKSILGSPVAFNLSVSTVKEDFIATSESFLSFFSLFFARFLATQQRLCFVKERTFTRSVQHCRLLCSINAISQRKKLQRVVVHEKFPEEIAELSRDFFYAR